jgi:hypothetical protein
MSRRVYLLGVGLALVALAFVVTDALLWEPGPTEANFNRIRVGMTLAEVERLLGPPSDSMNCPPLVVWRSAAGCASASFFGGRVTQAGWEPSAAPRPSPLAHLRAWLGW